jgi:hypothetical protein
MRWVPAVFLLFFFVGCKTWVQKAPRQVSTLLRHGHSITLEDYVARQRELNEQYLYGSPMEALKAMQALAVLEEDYSVKGQRPVDSDHARMLVYSRLFVLSERLRLRPEAEEYMTKALGFAQEWRPEIGSLSEEKKVDFIRNYVDDFEKGLEVHWKEQLK